VFFTGREFNAGAASRRGERGGVGSRFSTNLRTGVFLFYAAPSGSIRCSVLRCCLPRIAWRGLDPHSCSKALATVYIDCHTQFFHETYNGVYGLPADFCVGTLGVVQSKKLYTEAPFSRSSSERVGRDHFELCSEAIYGDRSCRCQGRHGWIEFLYLCSVPGTQAEAFLVAGLHQITAHTHAKFHQPESFNPVERLHRKLSCFSGASIPRGEPFRSTHHNALCSPFSLLSLLIDKRL
jgi:hypothetical protein